MDTQKTAETLRNEWRVQELPDHLHAWGHRGTQPPQGEIIQSRHKSVVVEDECEMSPNVLRESADEFAEQLVIKELIF